MKKKDLNSNFEILRQRAEQQLKEYGESNSEADNLKLIHEFQVQQIELEMQAEELILAKEQADLDKEKYTQLFDFAPCGYVSLSNQGEIVKLNFCAANMLGKDRLNLLNNKFGFFISEESRPVFISFFERMLINKTKQTCDVILSIEVNSAMDVHIDGIFDQKSERCFLTIVDITERKQFEKAAIEGHRLNAIGEMAASIAHDFNNSLQSIIGNLEIAMLQFNLPEPSLKYFKTIITVIEDATIRVQKIQHFSSKKQVNKKHSTLNLNVLATEAISQSQHLWKDEAEKNGLKVTFVTNFLSIPDISGNGSELRIALHNIIKNSIEAMPKGGQISIDTGKKNENGFLRITDTGVGMDENSKTRIFQPFFTTKGFELGRGLGMSGVYSIIREHKGTIQVENSELGKGTTIEISLPFSKNIEQDKKDEIISKAKNSLKVLWVEDDLGIRESACMITEILGHKCDTACSGKEALEHLEKYNYDVVISDIGMPEMSGWELALKIREKYADTMKIVLASGWSLDLEDETNKQHGISYILRKPFTIDELRKLFVKISQ
jgi:PAS domain S-box-containing protein